MQKLHYLSLADWRRQVADIYYKVRENADPTAAWRQFQDDRDELFANHIQTPLSAEQQKHFRGLNFYPYDPRLRLLGQLTDPVEEKSFSVDLPDEGLLRLTCFAQVQFHLLGQETSLAIFWVEGYGGGLFLPFRDKSNGQGTYSGGRYLLDGIKGADLGAADGKLVLDFNFAYNPSCAYNDRWVCPLAPAENWLNMEILGGEKTFL